MIELRTHTITLSGQRVTLRPLLESDWLTLLKWNSDPDVLYYAEGDNISSRSLDEVKEIYIGVSQTAYCFIAEFERRPIGECWLQSMNLERVHQRYPGVDCRRIDLMVGETALWGQGLGTEMIQLLTELAFGHESAAYVFGCDIADYNPRSLRAFQKTGYVIDSTRKSPQGSKSQFEYDLVLSRNDYLATKAAER